VVIAIIAVSSAAAVAPLSRKCAESGRTAWPCGPQAQATRPGLQKRQPPFTTMQHRGFPSGSGDRPPPRGRHHTHETSQSCWGPFNPPILPFIDKERPLQAVPLGGGRRQPPDPDRLVLHPVEDCFHCPSAEGGEIGSFTFSQPAQRHGGGGGDLGPPPVFGRRFWLDRNFKKIFNRRPAPIGSCRESCNQNHMTRRTKNYRRTSPNTNHHSSARRRLPAGRAVDAGRKPVGGRSNVESGGWACRQLLGRSHLQVPAPE